MKKFAYIKDYVKVGKILWEKNGFYKIEFIINDNKQREIFISSEIKLRNTDGYEEMTLLEIKNYIKEGKLKSEDLENFANAISKLERTSIYIILENLKIKDESMKKDLESILNNKRIL